VTNLAGTPETFSVSLAGKSPTIADVTLFNVPFVQSDVSREYVADPVVPMPGSVRLRTGESMLVMARISGSSEGSGELRTRIATRDTTSEVSIPYKVFRKIPGVEPLNSDTWAYLTFKAVRNARAQAIRDLMAHHINVVVVPPAFNPAPNSSGAPDLKVLRDYLSLHKGMTKALLYLDILHSPWRTMNQTCTFLGTEWKESLVRWYKAMLPVAAAEGFSEKQVYLYPYDEPQPGQFDEIIRFAKLVRAALPGVKLFSTIVNAEALEQIVPYLRVAQIYEPLPWQSPSSRTEYWRYFIVNKSTAPYEGMRLEAWRAFVHGYKGIGFWNYADTGMGDDPGSSWDDFDGSHPDYAVIYEGTNNTIVSSRRWEAWKLGLEDYQLLAAYAARKGKAAAAKLAEDVTGHPEDASRADAARRTLLETLSH
jgi:hypothetical protein